MLYEALVIDNSTFYSKGKIRVRIPHFYNREMIWNLSEDYPNFIEEANREDEEIYTNDFEAMVYSPYGGGRNFGVFFLPQINQKGVVMPIGQSNAKFLWLGSFFEPKYVEESFPDVEYVNIPSDKPGNEGEDSDGVFEGEQNMDAESSEDALKKNFVARFKTTKGDSQEGVDWQKRPTSNIITIGDKEASIRHYSEEDGWDDTTPQKWQDLSIHKNDEEKDEVFAEVHNEKDSKIGSVSLTEDKITLKIDNDGDISKFYIANNDDGIGFYYEDSYGNILSLDKDNGASVETEGKASVKSKDEVVVETDKTFQLNAASDTAVLYSHLKKIIEAFEKHIHMAPTGPTLSPLNSDQSPIVSKTTKPKSDMESKSLETD